MPALKVLKDNYIVLARDTIEGRIYRTSTGTAFLRVRVSDRGDTTGIPFVRVGGNYEVFHLDSNENLTIVDKKSVVYE